MKAGALIASIRRELEPVNTRVLGHPYLVDAEKGILPLQKIKAFVENQYYVVYHDLRSLAVMVSRAVSHDEADYLSRLQLGDMAAFNELLKLGRELGVELKEFEAMNILPAAVGYTHYLAWLALYGNTAEQVAALIVNLPVWGRACGRLAAALRNSYNVKSVGFLEGFANVPSWVEEDGGKILDRYLPAAEGRIRHVAKMIQSYELSFWDAIYHG